MVSATPNSVDEVLRRRYSVRGFLPDPVPRDTLAELLTLARLAPSGANLQPGSFHVLTGKALNELSQTLDDAITSGTPEVSEYSYFPDPMPAELKARQRAAGYALYEALGIGRRDTRARREQFRRNYRFFDAPVGIVVSIQRDMGKGCFMDLGMALMAFFLAAESRGLGATGIGALARHADVVHRALDLDASEMVVCGMAVGRPDPEQAVNRCRTERDPLDVYTRFLGFDD
ncbi:nitroreductase [Granulosicoccus sp. 3-233]|uniref:nitroreductase n=1 Tax=Granulosicoccus sp. 3-233 TaxID=3417969 RepID=UPI003D337653